MIHLPWEYVADDGDLRLGQARVLDARNELVCVTSPLRAASIAAAVNVCIMCPRCEGQEFDRGSCFLCGNVGLLDRDGAALGVEGEQEKSAHED